MIDSEGYDPDRHECPACTEAFVIIDGKDWRRYAEHLKSHFDSGVGEGNACNQDTGSEQEAEQ